MSTARREFGRRLRDERERRGITLQKIADTTKISVSQLAGLERGDTRQWPDGLFGRAHLRAYAEMVGLPPEQLVVEFFRLSDSATADRAPRTLMFDGGSRLALAEEGMWVTATATRAVASALDLLVVLGLAALMARMLQADLTLVCALTGAAYFTIATLAFGQSVVLWLISRRMETPTLITLRSRVAAFSLNRTAAASPPE